MKEFLLVQDIVHRQTSTSLILLDGSAKSVAVAVRRQFQESSAHFGLLLGYFVGFLGRFFAHCVPVGAEMGQTWLHKDALTLQHEEL